jgi:hypothetical protein
MSRKRSCAAKGQRRIAWKPPSPYRRREIIQGTSAGSSSARPLPMRARLVFIKALREAHRWLDELLAEPKQTIESIAARESKSERSIRMSLPLAFLSPDLVKAATDDRLPHGFGLTRLTDLPIAWSDQWAALGLKAPARTQSRNDECRHYRRASPRSRAQSGLFSAKLSSYPIRANRPPGNGILRPETLVKTGGSLSQETMSPGLFLGRTCSCGCRANGCACCLWWSSSFSLCKWCSRRSEFDWKHPAHDS